MGSGTSICVTDGDESSRRVLSITMARILKSLPNGRVVLAGRNRITDERDVAGMLRRLRLYKTLSLLVADRAGIPIPPTAALMGWNDRVAGDAEAVWGLPIMLRMDYARLPRQKYLGGFPVATIDSLGALSLKLLNEGFVPVLHPHIDRFQDEYSVGVGIEPGMGMLLIEAVGPGFDASDLRLGKSCPHEHIVYDPTAEEIIERHIIEPNAYSRERILRIGRVRRLLGYVNWINREHRLATTLNDIPFDDVECPQSIPRDYESMSENILSSLLYLAVKIAREVVPQLPRSRMFAASLSHIADVGWLLWDVYGGWYAR